MRTQEVLIVVRRGDEFLVVHRSPENDAYWHQIAGGVEDGETFAEAACASCGRRRVSKPRVRAARRPIPLRGRPRRVVHRRRATRVGADARLGARRLPVAAARGSGRAPLLARARRALAEPGVSELWHVSEDPTIEVFHPHHSELHALDEPLVWAVDSRVLVAVLVPAGVPARLLQREGGHDGRGRRALARRRPDAARRRDRDRLAGAVPRRPRLRVPAAARELRARGTSSSSHARPSSRSRSSSSATCSRATPRLATSYASRLRSIRSGTR